MECPRAVQLSLFYYWLCNFETVLVGSALNPGEDEDDLVIDFINQLQRCL